MDTGDRDIVEGKVIGRGDEAGDDLVELGTRNPELATPPAVAYTPIVSRLPQGVRIRPGVPADLPWIDRLQKANTKAVGFLPTMALEGKIKLGQVLVAEAAGFEFQVSEFRVSECHEVDGCGSDSGLKPETSTPETPTPIGYLIAADRYFKRDEVGYITQVNVVPKYRRSLVAAQLLQAQFDRSAYGCKLYCLWCAQDLEANAFWEAMGFVPIAFRTGSTRRGSRGTRRRGEEGHAQPGAALPGARVHIFWQKRIRAGDTQTPYWYPAQTGGGELREDRLVFPILPGVDWRDVGPVVLNEGRDEGDGGPGAEGSEAVAVDPKGPGAESAAAAPRRRRKAKAAVAAPKVMRSPRLAGGLWFAGEGVEAGPEANAGASPSGEAEERPTKRKQARKIDPRLTAMARELRDQWSERAAQETETLAAVPGAAKHDVRRIARASAGEPDAAPRVPLAA